MQPIAINISNSFRDFASSESDVSVNNLLHSFNICINELSKKNQNHIEITAQKINELISTALSKPTDCTKAFDTRLVREISQNPLLESKYNILNELLHHHLGSQAVFTKLTGVEELIVQQKINKHKLKIANFELELDPNTIDEQTVVTLWEDINKISQLNPQLSHLKIINTPKITIPIMCVSSWLKMGYLPSRSDLTTLTQFTVFNGITLTLCQAALKTLPLLEMIARKGESRQIKTTFTSQYDIQLFEGFLNDPLRFSKGCPKTLLDLLELGDYIGSQEIINHCMEQFKTNISLPKTNQNWQDNLPFFAIWNRLGKASEIIDFFIRNCTPNYLDALRNLHDGITHLFSDNKNQSDYSLMINKILKINEVYSHGCKNSQYAHELLATKEIGAWLIRYSTSKHGYYISERRNSWCVEHRCLKSFDIPAELDPGKCLYPPVMTRSVKSQPPQLSPEPKGNQFRIGGPEPLINMHAERNKRNRVNRRLHFSQEQDETRTTNNSAHIKLSKSN